MAKTLEKLTALFVKRETNPGWYGDGLNLWLKITPTGSKSWVFRYSKDGKAIALGLGATHTISLSDARLKAAEYRKMLIEDIDPSRDKTTKKLEKRLSTLKAISFADCATQYIKSKEDEWKNDKHREQWLNTLTTYAYPTIGKVLISDVDTIHITKILDPIWTTKTETASRLQGRMARIFDFAISKGYRSTSNPAKWTGHLEHTYTSPKKLKVVRNHPALDWKQLPGFMSRLRTSKGMASKVLEFAVLTASRSGEARLATWSEIDLEKKVWRIPAQRMKMKQDHTVPLTDEVLALLDRCPKMLGTDLIFPGLKKDTPLSDMAMSKLIKDLHAAAPVADKKYFIDPNGEVVVPHGFRATFKSWAEEQTDFKKDAIEFSLAHQLQNKTEDAYMRTTLYDIRKDLLRQWNEFATSKIA